MAKPAKVADHGTDSTAATDAGAAPQSDAGHGSTSVDGGRRASETLKPLGPLAKWADERLGVATLGKGFVRKVFPDHWSFLLGEIALYSFIILLITGVFLTIWFKPSMAEIEYNGTYQLLKDLPMSEAFASTVALSFDVRGGLLMRQMHHWAAMLFVGAMFAHMLRIFFTGAYRKPRELNWLLGCLLIMMGMVEGFAGYSLPDDLLSGTGLRFVDGLIRAIPIIGTWAEFFVFGGEFPGELIIPRLYMVHILLVPGLILGLIAAHLALVVYHKHTQYPGPGRTEKNVVGYPVLPVYAAKAGGFFFIVFGMIVLMGALFQINPVWTYGPYNPAEVTAGSQPDWYMGWLEGAIRIIPNWETHVPAWGPVTAAGNHWFPAVTWSWNIALPGLGLMGILFGLLFAYPFVERWITGDNDDHNLLQMPYQAPNRTAFGVAAMTCYGMFWLSGGNDILAIKLHLSLNAVTYFMRVAVFVAPVIAFIITKRICIGLQRRDRDRLLHGSQTGHMERSTTGNYTEDHVPISHEDAYTLTQHKEYRPVEATSDEDENGVRSPGGVSPKRAKASKWYFGSNIPKPTAAELSEAREHMLHGGHGEDDHDGQDEVESGSGDGAEAKRSIGSGVTRK